MTSAMMAAPLRPFVGLIHSLSVPVSGSRTVCRPHVFPYTACRASIDGDLADLIPPVILPAGNRQTDRRQPCAGIEQRHA